MEMRDDGEVVVRWQWDGMGQMDNGRSAKEDYGTANHHALEISTLRTDHPLDTDPDTPAVNLTYAVTQDRKSTRLNSSH